MLIELDSLSFVVRPPQLFTSLVTYSRSTTIQDGNLGGFIMGSLIEVAHKLSTFEEATSFLNNFEFETPMLPIEDNAGNSLTINEVLALRLCAVWCAMHSNRSNWGATIKFNTLCSLAADQSKGTFLATEKPVFLDEFTGQEIVVEEEHVRKLIAEATEQGVFQ